MTLQEATKLEAGDILNPNVEYADAEMAIRLNPAYSYSAMVKVFPKGIYNSDGSLMRYKVTSVKTWKRDATKVRVKARRGMYENIELTEETIKYLVKA